MRHLSDKGPGLKARFNVTFINAIGLEESGIDHSGLMIELIEEVMKAGLNPDVGLFQANSEGFQFPSPLADQLPHGHASLYFLGKIITNN